MVRGTWQCGWLDVIKFVDLIELIVKDVIEFRVLEDVVPFIM